MCKAFSFVPICQNTLCLASYWSFKVHLVERCYPIFLWNISLDSVLCVGVAFFVVILFCSRYIDCNGVLINYSKYKMSGSKRIVFFHIYTAIFHTKSMLNQIAILKHFWKLLGVLSVVTWAAENNLMHCLHTLFCF